MSANKISAEQALAAGDELWIIRNDPTLDWWKLLDLRSKYLLSENLLREKKELPENIKSILNATNIKLSKPKYQQSCLLLGTQDHFLNKWILIWQDVAQKELSDLVEQCILQLNTKSVRFFSDSSIAQELSTRPMASSISISYIENV